MLPPWSNRLPVDLGYVVAVYGIAAGDRGQSQTVFFRQHYLGNRTGYWLGGALGWIDRTQSFRSNEADAGAWATTRAGQFSVSVSTTRTGDREVFDNTPTKARPFATNVRVGDAILAWKRTGRRAEFEAGAGVRMSLEGATGSQAFGSVSLGWRLSSVTQLIVSGGSQVADPLRGTPQWRFMSIGVRLANGARPARAAGAHLGPAVVATTVEAGVVEFVALAPPTVKSVEVRGTISDWEPVALTYGSRGWSARLHVPPGAHRIQVRVDGGEWRAPANLGFIQDEFGSWVGLIVIR